MKGFRTRVFLVMTLGIILCFPGISRSEAPPPYTSIDMAKKLNQFRKEAGGAFIVPQVFQSHPGAMFVLMHAKDLNLTDKQIKKIRLIRRAMVTRSLRQIDRINKIRSRYLSLMDSRNPPLRKARNMYMKLTRLMAQATFDHVTGHIKVGKVLTQDQWAKLKTLH
jgi:Spy/CpxP family protein refolding chaperone